MLDGSTRGCFALFRLWSWISLWCSGPFFTPIPTLPVSSNFDSIYKQIRKRLKNREPYLLQGESRRARARLVSSVILRIVPVPFGLSVGISIHQFWDGTGRSLSVAEVTSLMFLYTLIGGVIRRLRTERGPVEDIRALDQWLWRQGRLVMFLEVLGVLVFICAFWVAGQVFAYSRSTPLIVSGAITLLLYLLSIVIIVIFPRLFLSRPLRVLGQGTSDIFGNFGGHWHCPGCHRRKIDNGNVSRLSDRILLHCTRRPFR